MEIYTCISFVIRIFIFNMRIYPILVIDVGIMSAIDSILIHYNYIFLYFSDDGYIDDGD